MHRSYREERFQVQRRRRRKGVAGERRPLVEPDRPNQVWSMDFVSDAREHGRRLKCLTIVEDFSKEAVDIIAAGDLTAVQAIVLAAPQLHRLIDAPSVTDSERCA